MPDGPANLSQSDWERAHRTTSVVGSALHRHDVGPPSCCRAALSWIALVSPRHVPGVAADPEDIARHVALWGRCDNYYKALLLIFTQLGLGDSP